jgi:hypothetical protein
MLLPIVLLLTSAAAMQLADPSAANGKQTVNARNDAQSFERKPQDNKGNAGCRYFCGPWAEGLLEDYCLRI